jgi:hypothetical protein
MEDDSISNGTIVPHDTGHIVIDGSMIYTYNKNQALYPRR